MSQPNPSEGSRDHKQEKTETETNASNSKNERMQAPKANYTNIVIAGILTLVFVVIGQFTNISISHNPKQSLEAIDSNLVMKHINSLIEIGNSEFVYEKSRAKAREYIRDSLIQGGIPPEQIFWHRFEWSEKKPQGRNITTTTWTGINIVVWTNSTGLPLTEGHEKIRMFGAHYDTNNWGENRTSGAHNNMAGTSLLIELAAKVYKQQANKETPFMFVFFDHKEPGSLGSKTFVDYYKIAKHVPQIAYFINVDSIGYRGASPIVQTLPYEDKGLTIFTPKWLAHSMIQSAFAAGDDGMNIGHQSLSQSIRYQAYRYHLISVPLLADDGPFAWLGVPSLLFTDYDVFFDKNADYNELTDLPDNIDTDALTKASTILSQFIVSAPIDKITSTAVVTPFNRFFGNVAKSFITTCFNGIEQYLIVGPFAFGFLELGFASFFMLFVVFQVSFASYRSLSKLFLNKAEHSYLTYLNHRVMFFHFVALVIAVCLDTVYAFIVILIAFPALICISNRRLNVITSIICCIALADFVMSSVVLTVDYGRKGPRARELRLYLLTATYIAHTFLVLAYGNDYYIKSKFKPKQE